MMHVLKIISHTHCLIPPFSMHIYDLSVFIYHVITMMMSLWHHCCHCVNMTGKSIGIKFNMKPSVYTVWSKVLMNYKFSQCQFINIFPNHKFISYNVRCQFATCYMIKVLKCDLLPTLTLSFTILLVHCIIIKVHGFHLISQWGS